jgi:competence protein ComEC
MATLAVIAVRYGRRPDFLSLLVICAALQLAIRPSDLHTLSFQLSVVATLALVLVFSARNTETPRQIAAGVAVTAVAACLATTPILALRLGEVTPATIPTNLLISPLAMIGFTLAAIAAGIGVLSPTLGTAAAIPASLVAEAILAIVERASYVFPMRHSTGAAPAGSLMVLTVVCWGIILAMSGDVKVVIARIWRWSGDAAEPVRAAVLAVPLVALIILGLGTLMR